jgi:DNA-binding response OmpR family regulator
VTLGRALLLQGDPTVSTLLRHHLILRDLQLVETADSGVAWDHLKKQAFRLIVLDTVPTGMDLTTLCKAIRRSGPNQQSAVIVVSASREEAERVLALLSGADDYLTIPFSVPEFHARISALLRRSRVLHSLGASRLREAADLTVDLDRRSVTVDGTLLRLTRREFDLLHLLMASPGVVFTRSDLLSQLGPRSAAAAPRVIDPTVSRLRAKLKRARMPARLIRTIPGVGYSFVR